MSYRFGHAREHERERLRSIERGGDPPSFRLLTAIYVAAFGRKPGGPVPPRAGDRAC